MPTECRPDLRAPSVGRQAAARDHGRHGLYWHEPSVPATARVGPEVGVELPMVRAGIDLPQWKVDRPSATRQIDWRR